MISKKILVTGGTGYIGNYITKILAATHPEVQVYSLSRKSPEKAREIDPQTSKFENVRFVSGDVLMPGSYPKEIDDCDSVIHTVGILLQGVNYQDFLRHGMTSIREGKFDPTRVVQNLTSGQVPYEQSYEAMNRDSCKLLAEYFNSVCKRKERKGSFVFISAEKAPFLEKYLEMKRQAEEFLLNNCPHLNPVILRPGFVWNQKERAWSGPVGAALDLAHSINKNIIKNIPSNEMIQPLLPQSGSINLNILADFAIKGALDSLDSSTHIWTNDMMTKHN